MDDYPDLPAGRDDLKTRTYHFVAGPARPWSTPSCALLLTLIVQVHGQHHGAAAGQVQPDLGQLLAVPLTDKSGKPQNQPDGSPGLVCPKWSTCEVDEKCQWEVENPGRTCNRPHYCLFCQKKFKQTRKHKEADCRKKTELAGTDTDQPTR